MKALTLINPWAVLVAILAKENETRSWGTRYRGPLAIHAGKGWRKEDRELCREEPFLSALQQVYAITDPDGADFSFLPRGAVIAIATLVDCRRIARPGIDNLLHDPSTYLDPRTLSHQERAFGDYSSGRYAWLLDDVVMLPEPVPAKGALGLWEWTQ